MCECKRSPPCLEERYRKAARLIGLVERVREVRQLVLLLLGLLFACLLVLTLLLPASLCVCLCACVRAQP